MNTEDKARWIARLAADKQAQDIVVLDLRSLDTITNFFVLCHGRSGRQTQAIADHIAQELKTVGQPPWRVEGYRDARWVLLDGGDAVVHIFQAESRAFYGLEHLWGDLPVLETAV